MSALKLSFVLVTDTMSKIEGVLEALDHQTERNALEVVVVLPAAEAVDEGRFGGYGAFRVVRVDSIMPMPAARAAGVRATTSPVIFIGETHSYPHPEFVRELIAAHDGPWDIIVPGLVNAIRAGLAAGHRFLLDYGYWLAGLRHRVTERSHLNASYKRNVLMELMPAR